MTAHRSQAPVALAAGALWLAAVGCSEAGLIGKHCLEPSCDAGGAGAGGTGDPAEPPADGSCEPLDLYLMVDDSGSMVFDWEQTLLGLRQFITDPNSAGVGVGIQFFGTSCDAETYSVPRVPIAPLPGNAAALQNALPALPLEESATLPAMRGAVAYARSWAEQHPDRKVAVILMTDSLSEECDSSPERVSKAARDGFEGRPSVETHFVTFGIGAEVVSFADQFANAGVSNSPVTSGAAGIHRALAQARDTARRGSVPCERP